MIPETPQTTLRRIAEYANGDDAAEWGQFVELYEPVVRHYIADRGDVSQSDADDVVQDVFMRLVEVLRNGEYKREKGHFRNYLAAIVRRILIDRHRRAVCRGAGRETDIDADQLESDAPAPADIVDMRLKLARRKAAIEHVLSRAMLDRRTVAAYREYAIDEQPAAAVAARHGMTVNNLRQLKHRLSRMIDAVEAELSL